MTSRQARLLAATLLGALPASALADQVFLKNGDRISGSIVSASGGKVVVAPDFAPKSKITLAQDDIASFTSPKPILLKLADGTMINQPVERGPDGTVSTAPGGSIAPQPVKIAAVSEINPSTAWSGSVGVNGAYSQSASKSAQLGISADGTKRTDDDRITASAGYFYGEQTQNGVGSVNTNNWNVAGKYDYFISKTWYAYANAKAEGDHVNFLSLRLTPGLGAGYQWIERDDFHLNTEAGASWVYADYSNESAAQKNVAVRLAYHVDKSWDGERYKVFHDLEVLPTVDDIQRFLVNGDAGIRTQLWASMYSELKASVGYDNRPAQGAKAWTSQMTVGVGLTY